MHRILHFSNKPPYPTIDGGCVAIKHVLEALALFDGFDVHHYTLYTYKHPYNKTNYPEKVSSKIKITADFIDTKTRFIAALKHLALNQSYNIERFYDRKVQSQLEQLLSKESFDVAVLESIYLLPYLSILKKHNIKVIVRTHNVEHHIWEGLAKNEVNFIKRIYLNILVQQLKKYELNTLKNVDGIISISEEDQSSFRQHRITVPSMVLPPIIEIKNTAQNYQLKDFYFLGAMDWEPNIEGITWLKKNVLNNDFSTFSIHLAGKGGKKTRNVENNIHQHGEVKDASKFIENHGICIIPIQSGSGVKIKLLENMAHGKPVITTSEGAKGVPVEHQKHVILANTPQEFLTAMLELHQNETLRKNLGSNAKTFIEHNYNSEKHTSRLVQFIQNI